MAAPGKESKEKKGSKEDASVLRRIAEELTALRADVDAIKAKPIEDHSAIVDSHPQSKESSKSVDAGQNQPRRLEQMLTRTDDAAVTIQYVYRLTDSEGITHGASDDLTTHGLEEILSVDDTRVARLGYALSSAPKVAILRVLLAGGPQSAAQIGEKTKLTTGSLYHHLRELTHAAVIESAVRNRFEVTEIGRQTALLLFVQAGRVP